MSSRERHFGRPLPEGWSPKAGEHVVVALVPGTLAASVMSGEIKVAAHPFFKVLLRYGLRQRRMMNFKLDDLRPYGSVAPTGKKKRTLPRRAQLPRSGASRRR